MKTFRSCADFCVYMCATISDLCQMWFFCVSRCVESRRFSYLCEEARRSQCQLCHGWKQLSKHLLGFRFLQTLETHRELDGLGSSGRLSVELVKKNVMPLLYCKTLTDYMHISPLNESLLPHKQKQVQKTEFRFISWSSVGVRSCETNNFIQ